MVASTLPGKIKNIDKLLVHCQRRRYAAKSNIICAGDRAQTLSYIVKGSVTILIEDDEGHEMIIAYLNSGDFFGELGLFEPDGTGRSSSAALGFAPRLNARSPKSATRNSANWPVTTRTSSTPLAARWPSAFVTPHVKSAIWRSSTLRSSDLAFFDVTGRVARCLLDLCKQPDAMTHPDGMQIKITRQEIGRIVGCSREMVGRVLKDLEERSLVHVKGKTMVVFGTR